MSESLTGKKIFVLYSDEKLRNILYGDLRNRFEIFYLYDYEKVKPLTRYYPGCIIVINLIDNDLNWLPDEIESETANIDASEKPQMVILYNNSEPDEKDGRVLIRYGEDEGKLKSDLNDAFVKLGGKGRRNFVRYGGSGKDVASISLLAGGALHSGTAHDVSASGLSCSLDNAVELEVGQKLKVILKIDSKPLELEAEKTLERSFDDVPVHILKFSENQNSEVMNELLHFIYASLDAEMDEFIKNLSN